MHNVIRDHAEPVFRPSATPRLVTRYDRLRAAGRWVFNALLLLLVAYAAVWALGSMLENAARADAAVRQASGPVCAFGKTTRQSCGD